MAESTFKRSVRFVASDEDGMPVKRRQAQQACESCRRKKKRCAHGTDAAESPFLVANVPSPTGRRLLEGDHREDRAFRGATTRRIPPTPESPEKNGLDEHSSTDEVASHLIGLSTSRFVGDLSPESMFIEATSKSVRNASLYRSPSDIGTWLPQSARQLDNESNILPGSRRTFQHGDPSIARIGDGPASLHTFTGNLSSPNGAESATPTADYELRDLAVSPPDYDYLQLEQLYLERIHPMLPILNLADIHESRRPKTAKHAIFRQAIALAAAVETSASKHLRLDLNGPLLSFQEFNHLVSKAIFSSLDANAILDRVDHIRVLAIMSFFYQPTRASERDLPSLIFSQAVHYAQSLGIHLQGYSGIEKGARSKDAEGLFCALWALDRINAAFHGRPCLFHDRDTDRDLDKCIAAQEQPAFRLFLSVAMMLDRVIWIYCPRNKGHDTVDMPVFESMIMDAGAEKLPPQLHATLEIFYHAVSVLSCRQPSSVFAPSAPAQAHLPHPSLNARRSLSADRIVDLVSSSLASPDSTDSVSMLPFTPYAVALSLSVAYRKMRYSKVPMYRMRGKTRFKEIVAMLKTLGEVYTCARVNAGLGEAILREMDKIAKELASSSGVGAAAAGALPSPREARPDSRRRAPVGPSSGSRKNVFRSRQYQDATDTTPIPSPANTGESPLSVRPGSTTQQAATYVFPPPPVPDELAAGQQMVDGPHAMPSSSFGDLLDVDIFGHFDPGFDLSAVDAALEANLDMGFPQMWTAQWPDA
ncbi:hypothetical protein VPNG_07301 [Cytospora leucostoma]|uniref:Xylanolytic transcriptional activator regulatory domain-containing protein n=1 Tax=Cytospora leucostoma TaxID=1230097 RepID=A0A423WKF8_9PEZI|nr:hypothetical protein VPNG_07301 [Cytospora leucostoma]